MPDRAATKEFSDALLQRMKQIPDKEQQTWYFALVSAALDVTGHDLDKSLEIADKALKQKEAVARTLPSKRLKSLPPLKRFKSTYLDIGHGGEHGNKLWWINDAGNLEVKPAAKEDTHMYYDADNAEWAGRYDKPSNVVSAHSPGRPGSGDIPQHVMYQLRSRFPGARIARF